MWEVLRAVHVVMEASPVKRLNDTLMRMQNSFDITQARKREDEIKVMPFKGNRPEPHAVA